MNENAVVQHMIDFIEEKEKSLQASKLVDTQVKNDAVKSILEELERELADEN